ncbi:MAG: ABC transporter permease [Sphingobacteriales bacterium]|nr:ABC transporter permease [Sphingobacteriales bacterium]OJY88417.1 MAG: ABC transporter permease [Sphingobacteriales bacterium 44-15]
MRTLKFLLQKEFRQILRNSMIRLAIFVMPVVQLIIIPLAADYEVKNINLAVTDHDHSAYSQQLVSKITASGYFRLTSYNNSFKEAFKAIENDKADLILEIPRGFEKDLIRENEQKLFVAVNAINGTKAGLGGAYLGEIIKDYNNDIRLKLVVPESFNPFPVIDITSSNWFNAEMNYYFFMVPGILAILVTMVGGFMSALNIVKEKEAGTIEQINVTPIKKHHFILGKLIPFWVLGNIIFSIGLIVARVVYGIVPVGSLPVLYACISMYLLAILGFGLLISTFCETQQQAMLIMFFFMMIFILMGGLYTPIESMPGWAQVIAQFNPAGYLIEVIRMVVLKGSGFRDITPHLVKLGIFAIVLNGWAVFNYKKTS